MIWSPTVLETWLWWDHNILISFAYSNVTTMSESRTRDEIGSRGRETQRAAVQDETPEFFAVLLIRVHVCGSLRAAIKERIAFGS